MPARNTKSSKQSNQEPKKSALFPSGNMDAETKAAYDAMMRAHGDKAVAKRNSPRGPVDMTPKTTAAFPELPPPPPPSPKPVHDPAPSVPMEDTVPVEGSVTPPESSESAYRPVAASQGYQRRAGSSDKMAEFVRAMQGVSSASVYTVKLSDGRELSFESPKVKVQKTLNQILSANQDDPAAQYMAQMSLLETVCLTKGVDWYSLSDFDRNKIMFSLYRDILFRDEYKYKCDDPKCGFEWMGKLDGAKILRNLDKADVTDKVVEKVIDGVEYRVRIGFPLAKSMVAFLTDYGERKRSEPGRGKEEGIDAATLLEYIDLFVKEIWVSKGGSEAAHINLDEMYEKPGTQVADALGNKVFDELDNPVLVDVGQCYRDVMDVLGSLPSSILQANSDDDVYTKISKMLIETVNGALPDCVCPKCGHRMGKAFGFSDFFSRG